MKSPSTLPRAKTKGFTLIEIMVTIGIIAVIGGLSLFLSMDDFRAYSFRGDRDMLISALYKARSQAINNICLGASCPGGKPHGIHFAPGHYVIFQGSSYGAEPALDEIITINNGNVQITSPDIIFAQLSGDAAPAGSTINVTDNMIHNSVITINGEGQIIWTN